MALANWQSNLNKTKEEREYKEAHKFLFGMDRPCLVYHENNIYIFGSNNNMKSYRYDCDNHIYEEINPLPFTPKGRSYAFQRNNSKIIVFGVKMDAYPYSSTFCVEYDIVTNKWLKTSFKHKHGAGFTAFKWNKFVIIAGGKRTVNKSMQGINAPSERAMSLIKLGDKLELLDSSEYGVSGALAINPANKNEILFFGAGGQNLTMIITKQNKIKYKDETDEVKKNNNNIDALLPLKYLMHFKCVDGFSYVHDENGNFIMSGYYRQGFNYGASNDKNRIIYYNYKTKTWYKSSNKSTVPLSCSMVIENNHKLHILGPSYHKILDLKDVTKNQSKNQTQSKVSYNINGKQWDELITKLKNCDIYYVGVRGETKGPFQFEKLKELYNDREISDISFLWNGTTIPKWTQLKDVTNMMGDIMMMKSDINEEKQNESKMEEKNDNCDNVKCEEWDNDKVCIWIQSIAPKFKSVALKFKEYGVDGQDLIDLDNEQLESMDITNAFLRKKLLKEIGKLINKKP
eukprot:17673_1